MIEALSHKVISRIDRRALLAVPAVLVWTALFLVPLFFFFLFGFWSVRSRIMRPDFTLKNYASAIGDYGDVLVYTLGMAFTVAATTTVLAYAFAYAIRFRAGRYGDALLFVTLITLFGGYLVKIYAWKSILGRDGLLNGVLLWMGVVDEPLSVLIYSSYAVVITLVYFLLPFAILPIYGSLRSISDDMIEAARDLGSTPLQAARDIVLPQCEHGIAVAFLLSFLIAAGDYVTPRFVGGGASMMGHFIETQFSFGFNWPMGSAMAYTLMASSLIVTLVCRFLFQKAIGA